MLQDSGKKMASIQIRLRLTLKSETYFLQEAFSTSRTESIALPPPGNWEDLSKISHEPPLDTIPFGDT